MRQTYICTNALTNMPTKISRRRHLHSSCQTFCYNFPTYCEVAPDVWVYPDDLLLKLTIPASVPTNSGMSSTHIQHHGSHPEQTSNEKERNHSYYFAFGKHLGDLDGFD